MSHYFGTDGFRGEAGSALTASHAFRIGRFLGHYYKKDAPRPRVAVGKDTRRSSYMLEYALAAGLVASGADAYMLHVTTTPSVSFVTRQDDMQGGVMISASHNPFFDNGIKLLNAQGEKTEADLIDQIEQFLDTPDPLDSLLPKATGDSLGRIIDHSAGRNRYIAYLISLARHSFAGWRVGLDCANGSAWRMAEAVFSALGAKTYMLGNAPNGLNINQGVGSTHIETLAAFVKSNHLDIGFAFDGDADRCLAVDEQGRVLTGDHILFALADEWQRRGLLEDRTVVTTVMSNMGLWRALDERGIKHLVTAVGDKYVYDCMIQHGCNVGGEQSGHIILRPYATTGDGLVTAVTLMDTMADRKQPLSRLAQEVRFYPQTVHHLRTDDKSAVLEHRAVITAIEEAGRMLGDRGRVLLRASGTEPVVRLMTEAETEALCRDAAHHVLDAIHRYNLVSQGGD